MFWKRKAKNQQDRERDHKLERMMVESQLLLLEAATTTADAARDLTTALKARLDDSIRQFENTARIMNDGLFLTTMDGTIQSFNPAAGRMFGRTDLDGVSITDLFQFGDQPITDAGTLWNIAEHTSAWLPNATSPLRGRRPDGTLFWLEPNVTRLDWSTGLSSMLILVRNQQPLVALSENARNARAQYKSVFEASHDGILILKDRTIVAANPAIQRIFGYATHAILRENVMALFDADDQDNFDGLPNTFEATGISSEGDPMPVNITVTDFVWEGSPAKLLTVKEA